MVNPKGWDEVHNYKMRGHPRLRLAVFWTNDSSLISPSSSYLSRCFEIFWRYGVGLDVFAGQENQMFPPQASLGMVLDYDGNVDQDDDIAKVRALANDAFDDEGIAGRKRLPVIFCPFGAALSARDDSTLGITIKNVAPWPPFVLINSKNTSTDLATLAHEIGHAGGCVHVALDGNVMNYPPPDRSEFLHSQMNRIVGSYFCKGG
jgi:hypothetical protein